MLKINKLLALCLRIIFSFFLIFILTNNTKANKDPEIFTYEELVELCEKDELPENLQKKLTTLLTTPFVNNKAFQQGVVPQKPKSKEIGEFLRVVFWNIERGLNLEAIELAFTNPEKFISLLDQKVYSADSKRGREVIEYVNMLKQADVIVLNEVDWGVKRTKYNNVIERLGTALKMNYAYGVEFVEIDPISLGTEKFEDIPEPDRSELVKNIQVDKNLYKGLHGTAILSRYRLDNVQLIPFTYQAHDWYEDEKKATSFIEKGKRKASETVFLEKIHREIRRGGRTTLIAEIVDEAIPTGKAVIVATHLESKTKPENRAKQLEELLGRLRNIKHPVIFAGDMNTSTSDATPTSILQEFKNRVGDEEFWVKQGFKYATGVGLILDAFGGAIKLSRTHLDPTVKNIRFISPNPEAEFFTLLEEFRFDDKGAFDLRGDKTRSFDRKAGKLANSNQRSTKGFVETYQVKRKIGPIGKFKLDWIFIKPPNFTDPTDSKQSYVFAPHFGQTLSILNFSFGEGISDHNPIILDLPFK